MKVILCDSSTINSYGFRTDVNGIDLTRFKKNPVMLYNHNPLQVIGKWENIAVVQTDGRPAQLTAEPVFDMDDPFAAEIARKVDQGFIKGCSMGIMITQITKSKGIDVATESVLLEASIVSIPADENALVVYADEDQQKKLSINEFNKLFYKMETNEITPTERTETEEVQTLRAQVADKDAKIEELTATIDTLRADLAEREYRDAESFVDAAIADGKIDASAKGEAMSFYLSFPKETVKLFGAIKGNAPAPAPEPQPTASLSSMLKAPASATQTWDDLDRIPNALKKLKADNPEEFRRLYREKFGSDPIA